MRGILVWLAIAIISWPVASFYAQPELTVLLPVVGLGAVIDGFASTALSTLVRRISPARQVALDIGARVLSLCVMIAWAWVSPTVWALVAGALVMSLITTGVSHMLIPGYANRIMFDRAAFLSLFRFGRWVFLSTLLTFLLAQGDRVFLGKVLSLELLGIYTIAFILSEAALQPINMLAARILQPLYARLRDRGPDELRAKTYQTRARLLSIALPGVCLLAVFGQPIVELLYDPRYWQAGWMLRILAVGAIGGIMDATSDRAILAAGDSLGYLKLQMLRSMLFVGGVVTGYLVAGLTGLLIGMSCARLVAYVPLAYFLRRHGIWLPKLDCSAFALSAIAIALGSWAMGL